MKTVTFKIFKTNTLNNMQAQVQIETSNRNTSPCLQDNSHLKCYRARGIQNEMVWNKSLCFGAKDQSNDGVYQWKARISARISDYDTLPRFRALSKACVALSWYAQARTVWKRRESIAILRLCTSFKKYKLTMIFIIKAGMTKIDVRLSSLRHNRAQS